MKSENSDGEILMPALGRDFKLGTLYNAQKDEIIVGTVIFIRVNYVLHLFKIVNSCIVTIKYNYC